MFNFSSMKATLGALATKIGGVDSTVKQENNFSQIAELRSVFKYAAAVSEVASSLILRSTRFTEANHLNNDAQKVMPIPDFIQWDEENSKAMVTEFTGDEDFKEWTKRLNLLCLLAEKVTQNYVLDENNPYEFSQPLLEKLRYFYRELVIVLPFAAKLDSFSSFEWPVVEMFATAVQHLSASTMVLCVTFLSIKENIERHQAIQKRLNPIHATQLSEVGELISVEDKITALENLIAHSSAQAKELQSKIVGFQENPNALIEESKASYNAEIKKLGSSIESYTAKIFEQVKELENLKEKLETQKVSEHGERALLEEKIALGESIKENQSRIENFKIKLKGVSKLLQLLDLNPDHYVSQQTVAAEEEIALLVTNIKKIDAELKNQQRLQDSHKKHTAYQHELEAARQNSKNNEENAWKEPYQKGLELLAAYHERQQLEPLMPTIIQCPSSDMGVLDESSITQEAKSFVSKSIMLQVRNFKRIAFSITSAGASPASSPKTSAVTFNFEVKFKDENNEQISTLAISSARCKPGYISCETPASISEQAADDCEAAASAAEIELPLATQHAINQLRVTGMKENDAMMLHYLICLTEPSHSLLVQSLQKVALRYDLSAKFSAIEPMFYFALQDFYFKYADQTISYNSEESSFFNDVQTACISQNNYLLLLKNIQDIVKVKFTFKDDLKEIRASSLLKIFSNMMRNINDLPEWIVSYFSLMSNSEHKRNINEMSTVEKIKLAFSFALEFSREVFLSLSADGFGKHADAAEFAKISVMLKDIQKKFKFPFSNTEIWFNLATNFLVLHSNELLVGTNFEISESKQSQPVMKTRKPSIYDGIKSLLSPSSKSDSRQQRNEVVKEPAVVGISDRRITLFVVKEASIEESTASSFVQRSHNIVTKQEALLGNIFLDKVQADEADVDDEYCVELDRRRQASESEADLNKSFHEISIPDEGAHFAEMSPQMLTAFDAITHVGIVLRELILTHPRFTENNGTDFPLRTETYFNLHQTNAGDSWIYEIASAINLKDSVFASYENSQASLFPSSQLGQLYSFDRMLTNIGLLAKHSDFPHVVSKQKPKTIGKLIDVINRFAATAFLVCAITLALKAEMELVQEVVNNLPNVPVEKPQSKERAWENYQKAIEFFEAYIQGSSALKSLALSAPIHSMLPAIQPRVIKEWLFYQQSGVNPEVIAILLEEMKLKPQALVAILNFTKESGFTIRLEINGRGKDSKQPSSYVLAIRPEQLSPLYVNKIVPEGERHLYSPLRITDEYTILAKDSAKSLGAAREAAQLQKIFDRNQAYSQDNGLLLLGIYGLIYYELLQRSSIGDSRMAKALFNIVDQELMLPLEVFRNIVENFIRPNGFKSSQSKKTHLTKDMKSEILHVKLALQMAILKFQTLFIAYTGKNGVKIEKNPFFDNHQLQFAIRGNAYLELFNLSVVLDNRKSLENALNDTVVKEFFEVINQMKRQMANLPNLITNFLVEDNVFDNITDQSNSMTSLQKVKLAFVFAVEEFRVIFSALKDAGGPAYFKEMEELMLHFQHDMGLGFSDNPEGVGFSLGVEFLNMAGLHTLNNSQENTQRHTLGYATLFVSKTNACSIELNATQRDAMLVDKDIASFFKSVNFSDPNEAVLLQGLVNHSARVGKNGW